MNFLSFQLNLFSPAALTGLSGAGLSPWLFFSGRVLLCALAVWLVTRCAVSLLRGRVERETWGRLTLPNGDFGPFHHWENTVGRSRRSDVVLSAPTVSRSHAAFLRDGRGNWSIYPLTSKNGTEVNGLEIPPHLRHALSDGDVISLGGVEVTFQSISPREELEQARRRARPGRRISPGFSLVVLTWIQCLLWLNLTFVCGEAHLVTVSLCFAILCLAMWGLYILYRILGRTGFEAETLAFFLTSLCLTVTANSDPDGLFKQTVCVLLGLFLFLVLSILLRDLDLAKKLRWPAAIGAGGLLGFNLLFGSILFGAKNWIVIGSFSFQPSELVKVAFVLVGATTLDRMFSRRNLIFTLLFSGFCVGCLGLMSDFGSALIFFATFLAIAFLRSGDLPSVAFMCSAAAFFGYIIIKFKPYIARRFTIFRHVWEDTANLGYQQSRTMSAIADGGLFGRGLGEGWLKNIAAANTDLVFGVTAQELGLIVAVTAVCSIVILAVFAVKSAASARSTFYVIAACSTGMLLTVQTMLNVFGSVDLLPLTGVTFPFLSVGGSSMISCWGLLAFLKAADTRQNAAISVRLPGRGAAKQPPDPETGGFERTLRPERAPDGDTLSGFSVNIPESGDGDAENWQDYFGWEDGPEPDALSDADNWREHFRWEEDDEP